MDGGLWPGEAGLVGARPGCGKTAVGLNVCVRCAETDEADGGAALFVSSGCPPGHPATAHLPRSGMSLADYSPVAVRDEVVSGGPTSPRCRSTWTTSPGPSRPCAPACAV